MYLTTDNNAHDSLAAAAAAAAVLAAMGVFFGLHPEVAFVGGLAVLALLAVAAAGAQLLARELPARAKDPKRRAALLERFREKQV